MTKTRTSPRGAHSISNGEAKREELSRALAGLPLLGEVVAFNTPTNRGIKNTFAQVKQALKDAGLPEEAANERDAKQAFTRAARELEKEGVIDILTRDDKGSRIVFQLSAKSELEDAEEGGKQLEYHKKARIVLHTDSGKISCKNVNVKDRAQGLLDRHLEEWNTGDVNSLCGRLFSDRADLIPFATGSYFVPHAFQGFTLQMVDFLGRLGRKMGRLPIPKGTGYGDATIQEAVEDYLDGMLKEMRASVQDFSVGTRGSTFEAAGKRIRNVRLKLEAYKDLLGDKVEDIGHCLEEADAELAAKIDEVEKERKEHPEEYSSKDGQTLFGFSITKVLRAMGRLGFDVEEACRALTNLGVKFQKATVRTWIYVGRKYADDRYGKPAELSAAQLEALRAAAAKDAPAGASEAELEAFLASEEGRPYREALLAKAGADKAAAGSGDSPF